MSHVNVNGKRRQASTCSWSIINNYDKKKYITTNWYSLGPSNSFKYWRKATWRERRKKAEKKHEQPSKFWLKTIINREIRISGSPQIFLFIYMFLAASSVVIHFSSQLSPKPKPLPLSCTRQEQTLTLSNEDYSFSITFNEISYCLSNLQKFVIISIDLEKIHKNIR